MVSSVGAKLNGYDVVMGVLSKQGQMPISDLEQLLASNPGGIGFGVEPHQVISTLLQLGQLEYGATINLVQASGPGRLKEKGALYFNALSLNPIKAKQMKELANSPEQRLYEAIETLRSVYGHNLMKLF